MAARDARPGRRWQVAAVAAALAAWAAPAAAAPGGPSDPPVSILGGNPVTAGEFPSVALLVIHGGESDNLCTGTLIAEDWVLTAAHCVDPAVLKLTTQDDVTANMVVRFNTLDLTDNTSDADTYSAVATFKDPLFNKDHLGTNDIGLIQLAPHASAPALPQIAPSLINFSSAMLPIGTVVTTVGYGSTIAGDQAAANPGSEFSLANRKSVSCAGLGIGSDLNLLCFSQTDGTGTCEGDSGGPSFASILGQTMVVAVTSFGDSTCTMFGAETRVDAEEAFITQHIPQLAGCSSDSECSSRHICFSHRCIASPFGPNGLGTLCGTPDDCESLDCVTSSQDGKRCSFTCSVSNDSSCPDGFECLRESGDVGACWPTDISSGCSAAGHDDAGPGVPLAIALGLGGLVVVGRIRRGRRRGGCSRCG